MTMWPWPDIRITLPHFILAIEPMRELQLGNASLTVQSHAAVAETGTIN